MRAIDAGVEVEAGLRRRLISGAAVAEVLAGAGAGARLVRIGVPDAYAVLGPPTHLYRHYGPDGEGASPAASARRWARAEDATAEMRRNPAWGAAVLPVYARGSDRRRAPGPRTEAAMFKILRNLLILREVRRLFRGRRRI